MAFQSIKEVAWTIFQLQLVVLIECFSDDPVQFIDLRIVKNHFLCSEIRLNWPFSEINGRVYCESQAICVTHVIMSKINFEKLRWQDLD